MKTTLYIIMVACFLLVGCIELQQGRYKPGVLAIALGILNAIIFLWKP